MFALDLESQKPIVAFLFAHEDFVYQCLSFSSVPGSEFISEQKIAPKILRKNKVLWRRYSCLINNVNIYHDHISA